MARKEGLTAGLRPLEGGVALHIACHARAQNMGQKGAEMLRLIPEAYLAVMERCSGHGGTWGVMKKNFEVAMKVGKPVMRQAAKSGKTFLASECPLAGTHIVQGMELLAKGEALPERALHPIELVARAYGIAGAGSEREWTNSVSAPVTARVFRPKRRVAGRLTSSASGPRTARCTRSPG